MEKITLTLPELAEAMKAGRTFAMANGVAIAAPQFIPCMGWVWECAGLSLHGDADTVLTVTEYHGDEERRAIAHDYQRDITRLLSGGPSRVGVA